MCHEIVLFWYVKGIFNSRAIWKKTELDLVPNHSWLTLNWECNTDIAAWELFLHLRCFLFLRSYYIEKLWKYLYYIPVILQKSGSSCFEFFVFPILCLCGINSFVSFEFPAAYIYMTKITCRHYGNYSDYLYAESCTKPCLLTASCCSEGQWFLPVKNMGCGVRHEFLKPGSTSYYL